MLGFDAIGGLPIGGLSDADTLSQGIPVSGGLPLPARLQPNPDGSIVVTSGAVVGVGVLASDAQHGLRGGGTDHAAGTQVTPGFLSAADKTKLDGIVAGTISGSAFFGTGIDGAKTIGTAALLAPLTQATTFHATGQVTVEAAANGLLVRATSVVTFDAGSSLNADSKGVAGSAGGGANTAGTAVTAAAQTQLFANPGAVTGGAFGAGGAATVVGSPGTVGNVGNTFQGGSGGGGGGGGGGTVAAGNNGGAGGAQTAGVNFDDLRWAKIRWDPLGLISYTNVAVSGVLISAGGGGGGGGGTGGGAGGAGGAGAGGNGIFGGGWVYLAAPSITGTGRISANGQNGLTGTTGTSSGAQGGGGGGGGSAGCGGGLVVIKTKSLGGGLTVQANGGTGGNGGNGGTGGGGGAAGGVGGAGGAGGAGIVNSGILP